MCGLNSARPSTAPPASRRRSTRRTAGKPRGRAKKLKCKNIRGGGGARARGKPTERAARGQGGQAGGIDAGNRGGPPRGTIAAHAVNQIQVQRERQAQRREHRREGRPQRGRERQQRDRQKEVV